MAKFPALPLFTDAILGDTLHLTNAQFGSYMLLLIVEWRTPDCTLPNDDTYLAKIARMDKRTWLNNRSIILSFFQIDSNGRLQQPRLVDERNYVEQLSNKNAAAGRSSALKRKVRHSTSVQPDFNENPTPTPTPIEKKEDKSSFQKNEEPSTTQMPKLIFDEEPRAKNVKRKSALKDDWKPNDNHRAKCAERGLDAGKLCEEFRNYHLARGNLFADWDRAFFTWIGNAERFGGGKAVGGAGQQGVGGIVEAGLRVAARYKNQG